LNPGKVVAIGEGGPSALPAKAG
ncbi:MAG: hypothetical protein K0Q80_2395, partial [Microvirga sp.]|nr:hypothetical protein [Microvirga sp.]